MKILYNVTIKISTDLHIEWLEWMKRVHIPEVMATGCFESYRITRILGDDDEHGVGFAVQYVSADMDKMCIRDRTYSIQTYIWLMHPKVK